MAEARFTYIHATEASFENKQEWGYVKPGQAYILTDEWGATIQYAYTDDGEGFFFYDSKNELESNHA